MLLGDLIALEGDLFGDFLAGYEGITTLEIYRSSRSYSIGFYTTESLHYLEALSFPFGV